MKLFRKVVTVSCIFLGSYLSAQTASESIDEYTKNNTEWAKSGGVELIKGQFNSNCGKKDAICTFKEQTSGNSYLISTNFDSWERKEVNKAFKISKDKDSVIILGQQDFTAYGEPKPLKTPKGEYVFKVHNVINKKQPYDILDVKLTQYECGDSCYISYVDEEGNEIVANPFLKASEEAIIEQYIDKTITVLSYQDGKDKIVTKVWFPDNSEQ